MRSDGASLKWYREPRADQNMSVTMRSLLVWYLMFANPN
jgi:hypothetical protein